ncbi:hypothetical protein NOI24_16240 [Neorhizobium galegae]|uniref:hypothetical protein n=1 Tax=Neorhizobium galegae TaxID=399 RepID=UPI0021071701|nr:hypothetical protein [Neorhizobium galegae]MCQ1772860.1 hypothetical protein [Neorhizobium galegae]MCQ1799193.1 hypothetical protein [Neorhizobium galegae]
MMITVSVANLLIGCLILITIGAKVGKWQNRRDVAEEECIQLVQRDLAIRLKEIPPNSP